MSDLNGIVLNLDETTYHAHPALSSTNARLILESPARYQYAQTHPQQARRAFDVGTAAHAKVLGIGSDVIAYPDEHLTKSGNVSTAKATLEWADEQRTAGLVPVSPDEITAVNNMAESVLAHTEARHILETSTQREVSLFANDPKTNVDIRARFDIYGDDVCADLKSTVNASPHGFMKSIWNFRYDVQQEHYLKARELVVGDRPEFRFIAVEKSAPHLVGVYSLNEQWQEIGDSWATAAREILRACTDANLWPGYAAGVHSLAPPMGLIYDHQERFETSAEMVI